MSADASLWSISGSSVVRRTQGTRCRVSGRPAVMSVTRLRVRTPFSARMDGGHAAGATTSETVTGCAGIVELDGATSAHRPSDQGVVHLPARCHRRVMARRARPGDDTAAQASGGRPPPKSNAGCHASAPDSPKSRTSVASQRRTPRALVPFPQEPQVGQVNRSSRFPHCL